LHSAILYARPDGDPASDAYLWQDEEVTQSVPLAEAIAAARANDGAGPLEIRLLRRKDRPETVFQLDLGSTGSALRWHGSESNTLSIRGQTDRSGSVPRPLTTVLGRRSLRDILCEPHGLDLCAASSQSGPTDRREDLLDYLAGELDQRDDGTRVSPDIALRLSCFVFWESRHVEVADIGLRDCWLAAVMAYASSNITLRGSLIEGSTYAFAAIGKKAAPEVSHSFQLTGNVWKQSPSTYRQPRAGCDKHNDWDCPLSIWEDVPWAVVHHHFWSPLNGALFTAKDILGNVRIADNRVIDAYNGIRVRLSRECLAAPLCRDKTNLGFEIVGNRFEKIRDNPVEPEGHAAFWIVKHNTFVDVHAAISTDGVSGHDFLVFGNIFVLEGIAGSTCSGDWVGSRQFRLTLGGIGTWSTEAVEGDDARCDSHRFGTVIKMGAEENADASTLLRRILFFNNSVRTRSPLFRGSPGPPITSYNNVVEFVGCGLEGPSSCRQVPDRDPSCAGKDVWTRDHQSVFAECFQIGGPGGHRMRFNAYNRELPTELDAIDQDRVVATPASAARHGSSTADLTSSFAIAPASSLAIDGCNPTYDKGDLTCAAGPAVMGALLPNGERFDLPVPFGFPFGEVLRNVKPPTK
ncbi:MAG TPA: hypothetical protein VGD57_09560, partial [Candidatus Dormibacteraeota bacterium]